MSWHCSPGLGAGFSLPDYLDGLRSRRARSTPMPAVSCSDDKPKDTSIPSPSGTTCAPSTADPGGGSSTLSVAGSPARTSRPRVKVQDLPEPVRACGSSISALLARYGLDTSLPKTVPCSVPVASAPSSKDLPAWGMTYAGACWALPMSVPRIFVSECGSWPTPTEADGKGGPRKTPRADRNPNKPCDLRSAVCMCPTPRASDGDRGGRGELLHWVKTGTPREGQVRRMFNTPTARDWKDGTAEACRNVPVNSLLGRQVHAIPPHPNDQPGGMLNPDWVEWLMGWPIGWTASAALETDRFRQWLASHGKSLPPILKRAN